MSLPNSTTSYRAMPNDADAAHESYLSALRVPELARQVNAKFGQSSYAALRRLECVADGKALLLKGVVRDYYSLQLAISLVRSQVDDDVLLESQVHILNSYEGSPN